MPKVRVMEKAHLNLATGLMIFATAVTRKGIGPLIARNLGAKSKRRTVPWDL